MGYTANIIGVYKTQCKIISFSKVQKQGIIIADDGVQYVFDANEWSEEAPPNAGDNVTFAFASGGGGVSAISYQELTSKAIKPSLIPSSISNNSHHSFTIPPLPKISKKQSVLPPEELNDQNFSNQQDHDVSVLDGKEDGYNIIDWTKKVILNNHVNFTGRARRKEYWLSYLGFVGLLFAAMIIDAISGSDGFFYFIAVAGLFLPSLAVTVRRLHYNERSGWSLC